LVLVYSAPSARSLQDIFIYNGFRYLDENRDSSGVDQFEIGGFDFPQGGEASLSYFALEGDLFLGVPPQDSDPVFPCDRCFDFLAVNGHKLFDALNPPNNLFNSSSLGGYTLGLDLDRFEISELLSPGDSSLQIRVGSGDGIVDAASGDPSGGGESFFLGYVMLSVERRGPNFLRDGTFLSVLPDEASPGERVAISLRLENEGDVGALGLQAQLSLPPGLEYMLGSLRLDGGEPIQGVNPLERGLVLGDLPIGGVRLITLSATINPQIPPGSRLSLQAEIRARNMDPPIQSNIALLRITEHLELAGLQMEVVDGNGDGIFLPGEVVRYQVLIPNPNERDINGVSLDAQLPEALELLQVLSLNGEDHSRPEERRVSLREMRVPGGGLTLHIIAQIRSREQLLALGIPAEELEGFKISNQARMEVAGQSWLSDDPQTPARVDPSSFQLSVIEQSEPQLLLFKSVIDLNGGDFQPGDVIRYEIRAENRGDGAARGLRVEDQLPSELFAISPSEGAQFLGADRVFWEFESLAPGESLLFSILGAIRRDRPSGSQISNRAQIFAEGLAPLASDDPRTPGPPDATLFELSSRPDLSNSLKRVLPREAAPGDRIRWEIELINSGTRPALNLQIDDPLDPRFLEVQVEDGGVFDGTRLSWHLPELASQSTQLLRFSARLPSPLEDGLIISNQAQIRAEGFLLPILTDDPETPELEDDPTELQIHSTPLLSLLKEVEDLNGPPVEPGDELRYTLRLENSGDATAQGLILEDPLDPNLILLEAEGAEREEGLLRWRLGDLPPGEPRTFSFRTQLQAILPNGLLISNQASAKAGELEQLSDDPRTPLPDATQVRVVSAADLSSSTKALERPGPFAPGAEIHYRIEIHNTGSAVAQNIQVLDPLAPELEFLEAAGASESDEGLLWRIPRLAPGEVEVLRLSVRLAPSLDNGLEIDNQLLIRADDLVDPVPSDDPSTEAPADPTRFQVRSQVDLWLRKYIQEAPSYRIGARISYVLSLRNRGDAPGRELLIEDPLPPELINWRLPEGARLEAGRLAIELPLLQANMERRYQFSAEIPPNLEDGQVVQNQARVGALLSDDPSTEAPNDPTRFEVSNRPELRTFEKRVSGDLLPGGEVEYQISLENQGSGAAQDLLIEDRLPEGFGFTGALPPAEREGRLLRWRLPSLEPGTRFDLRIRGVLTEDLRDGQEISNQARVEVEGQEPLLSDDPETEEIGDATRFEIRARAELRLEKQVSDDNGPPFAPGDSITWRLLIENIGNISARGVEVLDVLPRELENPRAVEGHLEEGIAYWVVDELPPGERIELLLRGRIAEDVEPGIWIRNEFGARIGNQGRYSPAGVLFQINAGRLAPEKQVFSLSRRFTPGEEIRYRISLHNPSLFPVEGARIRDPLPLDFLEEIQPENGGIFDPEQGVVIWSPERNPGLQQIPAGGRVAVHLRARIRRDLRLGTRVGNQAIIWARTDPVERPSDDPNTPEEGDFTLFEVEGQALPQLEKRLLSSAPFLPGQQLNYEIELRNEGNLPLEGLLYDLLPEVLSFVPGSLEVEGRQEEIQRLESGLPVNLAPGERLLLRFDCLLSLQAALGIEISNQARLEWTGQRLVRRVTFRTVEGAEIRDFVLQVSPSNGRELGEFFVGDQISWRFEFLSQGPTPLRAQLESQLPPGLRFIEESLTWNGRALSAAPDGDPLEFQNGLLSLSLGDLGGGQHRIEFETRITELGFPRVALQGRLWALNFPSSFSDNNRDLSDGLQATVIEVQRPIRRELVFSKHPDRPKVLAGEMLSFQFLLENRGNVALEGLSLVDDLPGGFEYQEMESLPESLDLEYSPAPAGLHQAGRLEIRGISLEPGERLELSLKGRVDRHLREDVTLNNEASVESPEIGEIPANAAVEVEVRLGLLLGQVALERPGEFSEDQLLSEIKISLWDEEEPDRAPSRAKSDEEGLFELKGLLPGTYTLRLHSKEGVLFHQENLYLLPGEERSGEFRFKPTGRVYDAVEEGFMDGAQVFIYRDEDLSNNLPFDENSLQARRLVPGADLESASQQGQRTAHGGLYHFGVKRPGRYLLEVLPPGEAWVSPSSLLPPEQGFSLGAVEVSPSDLLGKERRYYLAFELKPGEQISGNHLPLDPLSALIEIQKRSHRPTARLGELVSYTIEIINRSPTDLIYDLQTGEGGVYLQDQLPKGFKYVNGSSLLSALEGSKEKHLFADDPKGAALLLFGHIGRSGVLLPFDLPAGATRRLRYQAVVTGQARPNRDYSNRATLLSLSHHPLSRTAEATVRVLPDPDFDQGLLLGRVFCDLDGDGEQQEGEPGLPGVRLYLDTGALNISDGEGRFHFKEVDPGTHALKLDSGSLLPGGEVLGDALRVIHISRGLPVRLRFPVSCPGEPVGGVKLELKERGKQLESLGKDYLLISGDVELGILQLGERRWKAPRLSIKLEGAPEVQSAPLRFKINAQSSTSEGSWKLWITPQGRREQLVLEGAGLPPKQLSWEGHSLEGRPFLKPGQTYSYRLELNEEGGSQLGSPVGIFGYQREGGSLLLEQISEAKFEGVQPSRDLKRRLRKLREKISAERGPLRIEVHGAWPPTKAKQLTEARAGKLSNLLKRLWEGSTLEVVAMGNQRPLVPNLTTRGRRRNRRLEIYRVDGQGPAPLPVVRYPMQVHLGRERLELKDWSHFSLLTPRSKAGNLELFMQAKDGRRLIYRKGRFKFRVQAETLRELSLEGRLPDALSLGGLSVTLPKPQEALHQLKEEPGTPWILRVDGQRIEADGAGEYRTLLQVRGREALLFDVQSPEGLRLIFPLIPRGAGEADQVEAPYFELMESPGAPLSPRFGQAAYAQTESYQRVDGPSRNGGYSRVDAPSTAGEYARVDAPSIAGRYARVDSPSNASLKASDNKKTGESPEQRPSPWEKFAEAKLDKLQIPGQAKLPAQQLEVQLPKAGTLLKGRSLPVRGRTAPGNKILLNGQELDVDEEGRFSGSATLKPGEAQLEIIAQDPEGNRGIIHHPLKVPKRSWFLMALGESLASRLGDEPDGFKPQDSTTLGDTLTVHGRAVLYLKGYTSGEKILGGLFEQYEVTAHLDSSRRAEEEAYFRQIVDPEAFYPIYGDDSEELQEAQSRGPLYLLIHADDSRLTVGNFRSKIKGIELFKYERALYGATLELVKERGAFRHQLKLLAADLNQPERHAFVELEATGGSLYYLPHRDLLEGSERIYLVERDRLSGMERSRKLLLRERDYSIRYSDGRLLCRRPISRFSQANLGPHPGDFDLVDGHPQFLTLEYDHRDPSAQDQQVLGVQLRERWEGLTLGAGYIQERNGERPDYRLWGTELRYQAGRRSFFEAEMAESQSQMGESLFSSDGGLSFAPFNSRDGLDAEGRSYLLRTGFELDDLIGEGKEERWYSEAYWQYLAPGFYSSGTIQQQGLEKYGFSSRLKLNEQHQLQLQYDGMIADAPESQSAGVFSGWERSQLRLGHAWTDGGLKLNTDFIHQQSLASASQPEMLLDSLQMALEYPLDPRWTLLLEQEAIIQGDQRLHKETADLFTSGLGLRYALDERLSLEAKESLRWSGDNATEIGLRSQLSERHTFYAQERFQEQDDRYHSVSVLGAEEALGSKKQGRAYGEYQLESGSLGQHNRAVMGLGGRFQAHEDLTLEGGFEHSTLFGDRQGESSRDTLHAGFQWKRGKRLQLGGRYELRYEDQDESLGQWDRYQLLTRNHFQLKLHRDLNMKLRLNYFHTYDLEHEATEAEIIEGGFGLAWRPVRHDRFMILFNYGKRYEQRPIDVTLEEPERVETDVLSLIPILELPFRFQLVEKLAYKRFSLQLAPLPTTVSHNLLWINRLNFHLTGTWDLGAEYRFLHQALAQTTLHGSLFELDYIIEKKIRLGFGYNFTSFSDEEFSNMDEDHGGPFFRLMAHY